VPATQTLVVITGPPGSGKSSLARALGARLQVPVYAKDSIKEALFDCLGEGDREWSRRLSEAAYGVLNAHLAGRKYVVGARLTIADVSICGYLFWPEEIGVDWAAYPALAEWLERIRAEPRWVRPYALMPGHPLPPPA